MGITEYAGFIGLREREGVVISCLTVNSPDKAATMMSPCTAFSALSTTSISPSFIPAPIIESPLTRIK
ncbi:hypothetical protein D3C71_1999330 [compost metagenome]